jgi:predicted nucleic acid-binding protein
MGVTRASWSGEGPVLADTSAWIVVRSQGTAARRRFELALAGREILWCWPVRYELNFDARGEEQIAAVDRALEGLREIAVDGRVQRGVLTLMRELAGGGSHGAHRFPLTDLTVAVAAQAAGVAVLHHDTHFDTLAPALGIEAYWI